jgi:putative aldouronate transport system substrate-binding protein
MRIKKLLVLLSATVVAACLFAGCGSSDAGSDAGGNAESSAAKTDAAPAATTDAAATTDTSGEIKHFTSFFAFAASSEVNSDNDIKKIIAEKIGADCEETFLVGQTDVEAIGAIVAGGEYPDFINGGEAMISLYEAGALIAWDDYIDKYPNIKEFFSDAEWDKLRQSDGKIYWMNPFENSYGERKDTEHSAEAFWIQVRVLEWAGYPKVETVDQYFDLLEGYVAENPTMPDGTAIIPYTILTDDWYYYGLENVPAFLDGYPNDGSAIVTMDTPHVVKDYNNTDTAKYWFGQLNSAYKRGLIDDEFATMLRDEYISKIATGAVLGFVDQWWNFAYDVNDVFKQQGFDLLGCNYVPLPITREAGMENQWSSLQDVLNIASGIAITVDCKDPEGAFQMINDLLDQEISNLRFWGVEGVDYEVDENGLFYRTEEQMALASDTEYKRSHFSTYQQFPMYFGTSRDGINAMQPSQQPSIFQANMAQPLKDCFAAYGAGNYIEMLGSVNKTGPWFPIYSRSSTMTTATPGGLANQLMGEVKHQQLPLVVMADDFDAAWETYMEAYNAVKPEDYLAEMQQILDDFLAGIGQPNN